MRKFKLGKNYMDNICIILFQILENINNLFEWNFNYLKIINFEKILSICAQSELY